jgi:hypothetical protein
MILDTRTAAAIVVGGDPVQPGAAPTMSDASLIAQAFDLANRAVISDIETGAVACQLAGVRWYDTRPMLDEREHDSVVVDMAGQAIGYALASRLVIQHPDMPHLVRIANRAG